jgi:hypothetical protein
MDYCRVHQWIGVNLILCVILVQTKNRLDEFYAPFNAKLFEMLGRELNW